MNDNRLIAEFMGHKLGLDGDGMGEPQCRIFENGLGTKRIENTYSKSWDWLMPVVQKIESLGYVFTIQGGKAEFGEMISETRCFIADDKLSSTHKAVVWFIQEYNLTPKEVV